VADYVLTAASGDVAVASGADAKLLRGRKLQPGSHTAFYVIDRALVRKANAGTTVTVASVAGTTVLHGRKITAGSGAVVVTGMPATLYKMYWQPPGRTAVVPFEDRVAVVPYEDRVVYVTD
jgi:hypothetical protein